MKKVHTLAIDQKEDAKHGESFFPVQKYITNLSSEYMGVTNHWHEEAELTLITSGKCIYKIDLVEYEVEEGDILFVPPLFLHSITLGNNKKVSSETYVFHLKFFKETMGMSFIQYLNDYRLEVAAKLLTTTSDDIIDISVNTGFENLSYFNRCFKKKYGTTPGRYRKKH